MKYTTYLLSALLLVTLWSTDVESRRVNVKPTADDEQDGVQAADDEQLQQQFKPVLIARRPLQHRPQVDVDTERQPVVVVRQSPRLLQQRAREQEEAAAAAAADDEDEQRPQQVIIRQQPLKQGPRSQLPVAQQLVQQRIKEQQQPQQQKEPTAQTIRNFNKLNDDGSFTFGYEADDGSFKEETRGTDCVVRGKYGYVDPDGNKREFTYVQGNPCDPNAAAAEDEDEQQQQPGKPGEEENVPANNPIKHKPAAKKTRPTTTLFQQTFGDFEQQPEPQPQPSTTPRQPGRQQTPQTFLQEPLTRRPQPPQISSPTSAPPQFRPAAPSGNLESAIRNLPPPSGKAPLQQSPAGPNSPLYTTELVFDPATGQYNTVIFQQVPKQSAGLNINQRLPLQGAPARQQPQFQPLAPPQFQPQSQFRPPFLQQQQPQPPFQPAQRPQPEFDFQRPVGFPAAGAQQQLVQQQQAMAFQQSQNLFRQQQQKQQQQAFQPQSAQFFPQPPPPSQRFEPASAPQFTPKQQQQRFEQQPEAHQQQFVLVQPGRTPGQQSLAAGQIDAFLRGHNVQF